MVTRIDATAGWDVGAAQTGTFVYDNGSIVTYSYYVEQSGMVPTNPYGGDAGDYAHLNIGDQIVINFDQPANGVSITVGHFDVDEVGQVSVDGMIIELDEWLADGRITITGPNAIGDGSNLLDANGDIVDGAANTVGNFINFQVPVNSLVFHRTDSAASSGSYHDIYIDREAEQPAPCFTAGTLIETQNGPVPVEILKTGDMIKTKDHGFQPVKWVGESRIYASGFDVPLRIKKGTFGNTRDLVVSKRHKMLMDHTHLSLMFDVEEAFACAMHLRNDDTITREPEGWVTYYHILLPQHEVIFAEGAATESFYPDEGTLAGMATKTKEELLTHFDPTTYGPQARLTFDPMRAMWIGRNLDILNGDDMGQIAAYENAQKAAE